MVSGYNEAMSAIGRQLAYYDHLLAKKEPPPE